MTTTTTTTTTTGRKTKQETGEEERESANESGEDEMHSDQMQVSMAASEIAQLAGSCSLDAPRRAVRRCAAAPPSLSRRRGARALPPGTTSLRRRTSARTRAMDPTERARTVARAQRVLC
eukprot:3710228-Pleurochrysis_carterae.AAC.2